MVRGSLLLAPDNTRRKWICDAVGLNTDLEDLVPGISAGITQRCILVVTTPPMPIGRELDRCTGLQAGHDLVEPCVLEAVEGEEEYCIVAAADAR